jgi:hypothetical protein
MSKPALAALLVADAYKQLANAERAGATKVIAPKATDSALTVTVEEPPPPGVDLLSQVIERVRPMLDRKLPLKDRVQALWAATKNARSFAASDVLAAEFCQLARDTGLRADLDDPVRKLSGEETVRHVVDWGCRGMNPFETGPLQ